MNAWKLFAVGLVGLGCVATVAAQQWPNKPVRLIVPYPAGGGLDPVSRMLGQKLTEAWKVPVVVENKPGASGSMGAAYVAQAPADGHTILTSAIAEVAINQYTMQKLAYDPEKDLKPVTLMVRLPFVLVTHPSRPYSTAAELIEYARKNPGKVTYASSGPGTPQHLAGVLFEQLAGVTMTHVPYKGIVPSVQDLLGGHVDIGFAGLPTGLPHVQSGALKALGLSALTASPSAPQIAPLSLTKGLQGFELTQWFAVFVPKNTPDAVVQRIQQSFSEVLRLPEVKESLEKQGAQPSGMSTEEFTRFLASERDKFSKVVKTANIQ